jgi:hypothetical protein
MADACLDFEAKCRGEYHLYEMGVFDQWLCFQDHAFTVCGTDNHDESDKQTVHDREVPRCVYIDEGGERERYGSEKSISKKISVCSRDSNLNFMDEQMLQCRSEGK